MCNQCSATLSVPNGAVWQRKLEDGTMQERYTFADDEVGLAQAWETTVSLRRAGFRTHLERCHVANTDLATVVATPPKRPTRKERGAIL